MYIALTFTLQIQPIYSVSEAETMPLFTVAGSASLLGSKIARICFQQPSFPTFSNAEGLLIFLVLFFLSTEAQGRNVRGLLQDFTASGSAFLLLQGRDQLRSSLMCALGLSRTTSLCFRHLQGVKWGLTPF